MTADAPLQSLPDLDALEALLDWHMAMGVDLPLADRPVDRFAEPPPAARPRPAPQAAQAAPAYSPAPAASSAERRPGAATVEGAPLPSGEAIMAARALAASAASLDELRRLLQDFDGCNLKLTAKNLVFGDGVPTARVMLVGEAPGRDEDIEGRPFVGRSGQLLDRMLAAIGSGRDRNAYIANAVYWRPPGNRDPSDQEIAICRPFILRQIELINPEFLVFLGAQPVKALMGGEAVKSGIRKLRGRWLELETGRQRYAALPTFHPAYLLRAPIEKRMAWRDFLAVQARLRATS